MKKKQFKRAKGIKHLEKAMEELSITATDLSEALGVSRTAVTGWIKNNDAPAWTTLAVECLRRRAGKLNKSSSIVVVKANKEQLLLIETFCKGLDTTFMSFNAEDF